LGSFSVPFKSIWFGWLLIEINGYLLNSSPVSVMMVSVLGVFLVAVCGVQPVARLGIVWLGSQWFSRIPCSLMSCGAPCFGWFSEYLARIPLCGFNWLSACMCILDNPSWMVMSIFGWVFYVGCRIGLLPPISPWYTTDYMVFLVCCDFIKLHELMLILRLKLNWWWIKVKWCFDQFLYRNFDRIVEWLIKDFNNQILTS
jgi:hypothetical protein